MSGRGGLPAERVRTSTPVSVTSTMCSHWADRLRSRGDDGPAVGQLGDGGLAGVDHRLDREDHAGLELDAGTGLAVMKHLGVFVEVGADAVAAEFTHYRKAVALGVLLDGVADVAEMGAGL